MCDKKCPGSHSMHPGMLIRDSESMSADNPVAPQGVIKCNGSIVTICLIKAGFKTVRNVSVRIKAVSLVWSSV